MLTTYHNRIQFKVEGFPFDNALEQRAEDGLQILETLLSLVVCDHHLWYDCVCLQEIGKGADFRYFVFDGQLLFCWGEA